MASPTDTDADPGAAIKRGMKLRVAEIRHCLTAWADRNTSPADAAALASALLELAVDHRVEIFGEADARDDLEAVFAGKPDRDRMRNPPH